MDGEADWWNIMTPATTSEDRAEQEWWQSVEEGMRADQLGPSKSTRVACSSSGLSGEAPTNAGDQDLVQ